MPNPLAARKDAKFKAVSIPPSINKTPGPGTPPIPYPVTQNLSNSTSTASNVFFNENPAYLLGLSHQPTCIGDQAGTVGGIKSGTFDGTVKPSSGCSCVRVQGKKLVREGDKCEMNGGNTVGVYVIQPSPSGAIVGGRPTRTNQATEPETPKEKSWWSKASGWVHGALDVAGFIPGLGAVPDLINAGIYSLEGDKIAAGISLVAAVPIAGDAVKAGSMVAKGGKALAKELAEKTTKETAERLAKEAAENTAKSGAKKGGGKGKGSKIKKKGKGPCDHLRKGKGDGEYRGGAHSGTSKPQNDKKDSHHMPAKDAAKPMDPNDGPAIQMDPTDHARTSSNGQRGKSSIIFRKNIAAMLRDGRWRDALAMEIKDVRRVAKLSGDIKKYNTAITEMLEYFKCLAKHGLLK